MAQPAAGAQTVLEQRAEAAPQQAADVAGDPNSSNQAVAGRAIQEEIKVEEEAKNADSGSQPNRAAAASEEVQICEDDQEERKSDGTFYSDCSSIPSEHSE